MPTRTTPGTIRISVVLSADVDQQLRIRAASLGLSKSETVASIVARSLTAATKEKT